MGSGISSKCVYPFSSRIFEGSVESGEQEFLESVHEVKSLFSSTIHKGVRYILTIFLDPEFSTLEFTVSDTRREFFQYSFSINDLQEIRESIDVNRTVGWRYFFKGLHKAYRNEKTKLNLVKKSFNEFCELQIEISFPVIGRTTLFLKLERMKPTYRLKRYLVDPLFHFFQRKSIPSKAQKIEYLERQIRVYRERMKSFTVTPSISLKNSSKPPGKERKTEKEDEGEVEGEEEGEIDEEKQEGVGMGDVMTEKEIKYEAEDDTNVVTIPARQCFRFLVKIRNKLVEKEELNQREKGSFVRVLKVLANSTKSSKIENLCLDDSNEFGIGLGREIVIQTLDLNEKDDFRRMSNIKDSRIREGITNMFKRVDEWNFDVFTLDDLTKGQTLFITAYTLFFKYDLLNKFSIKEDVLVNFLREIQRGYHPNQYHCALHAADVTQVLHVIIHKGRMGGLISDLHIFSALFAALIHDLDHPGLNNNFQINSGSYLAVLYNDRSVLENHHCATAFEILKSSGCNVMENIEEEKRLEARETIIEMVLSTDMSVHSTIIGKFRNKLELDSSWEEKDDIRLVLDLAIKIADVSNPSRPTYIYLQWAKRLCAENYIQGDMERDLTFTISPLMDRHKPTLQKGQIAFVNYIIIPMFSSLIHLFPKMKFCMKYIKANKKYWSLYNIIDDDVIQSEKERDIISERKRESRRKRRASRNKGVDNDVKVKSKRD